MVAPVSPQEAERRIAAQCDAKAAGYISFIQVAAAALGNITPNSLNEWTRNYISRRPDVAARLAAAAPGSPPTAPIAPRPPPTGAVARDIHDAAFWRGQHAKAEKARHELEVLAEQLAGVRGVPVDPAPWQAKRFEAGKSRSIIIAHTSDLHAGEVIDPAEVREINAYNSAIARERMDRYFSAVCEIGDRWLADGPCDGVLLTMAGDLISGDIHEELSRTNDLTSHEQVALVVEIYERGVKALVEKYGAVHVVAVPGNHGRTTVKPTAKLSARLSYDILAASILRDRMKSDERVTWSIATGYDVRVPVYGRTILVTHGDRIGTGGGQGFAGPVLPIIRGGNKVRLQSASAGLGCDLVLMGHYHTSAAPPGILANGSVPGYSEYGHGLRSSVEPPKQWLARFSSTWGLCETLAVQLAETKSRWKAK